MKYKVGDRVRIKSIDWYNKNKDENGNICYKHGNVYPMFFTKYMSRFCGETVTIKRMHKRSYYMNEAGPCEFWTDEMIEGLVEEETKLKYEDDLNGQYYSTPKYLVRPSGYQFVDENGNVINATKIVLEKKKKEYPKTYEECYKIMDIDTGFLLTSYDLDFWKGHLLTSLQKLYICRDAYWKIAGEEMGLDKPWKPDWNDKKQDKHGFYNEIKNTFINSKVFVFPTAKMRDAFYENFKELIEQCIELL